MEALQMLKFHLKEVRLNFTQGWITPEKDMLVDDPDEDLLETLLQGSYDDGLDQVIQAINVDED
jgi:hypothetical protein